MSSVTVKRLLVILGIVLIATAVIVGCGGSGEDAAEAGGDEAGEGEAPLSIGLVYSTGGRGDKGLNDMMYGAVKRVSEQYGWEYSDLENETAANVEPANRQFAQQAKDVIINFGFGSIDVVNKLAREYPEIKFITIDAVTDELPNVLNFTFREHEGSFLVGLIAGLMTETGQVGFVGGMENDLIRKFEAGYRHGVETAGTGAEVLAAYAGTTVQAFADPIKGKEIALSFYNTGADIVYHASGATGQGVFEAAVETDQWAIGVDTNQYAEAPDNILTSMLKRADTAIETALVDIAEGNFTPGHQVLGLAEDGVGYVNDETNEGMLPPEVVSVVEQYREQIKNGEFEVATTLE
jgi:basic membrane protein A